MGWTRRKSVRRCAGEYVAVCLSVRLPVCLCVHTDTHQLTNTRFADELVVDRVIGLFLTLDRSLLKLDRFADELVVDRVANEAVKDNFEKKMFSCFDGVPPTPPLPLFEPLVPPPSSPSPLPNPFSSVLPVTYPPRPFSHKPALSGLIPLSAEAAALFPSLLYRMCSL